MRTFLCLTCACLAAFIFSGCASSETRTIQTEEYRGEGVHYEVKRDLMSPPKFGRSRWCYTITQVAPAGCEWREVEEQCEVYIPYRLDTEAGNLVTGGLMLAITPPMTVLLFVIPEISLSEKFRMLGWWVGTGFYNMNILVSKNSFNYSQYSIDAIWESDPRGALLEIVPKGQWQPVPELRRRAIGHRTVELRVPSRGVSETFMTYPDGTFYFSLGTIPWGGEESGTDVPAQIIIEPGTPNEVVIPFTIRVGQN